ncbi:hypothetical protein TNCV_1657571 [Trichonephila clavipes]|nr:hypothetical protein TNCV_1657571 [Trichonephila clavipes]
MLSDGTKFAVGDIEKSFEKARRNTMAKREKWAKRCRRDETLMPSTCCYHLRPRRGAKGESRPSNEKRTQQGGPVRSRRNREQHYSPYAEEKIRPGGRSTRSRRGRQQHCQERTGGVCEQSKIPVP